MRNFIKYILGIKRHSNKILIISICILIIVCIYIYNNTYYIFVRFNELGPVSKNMSAYYNGFKVGKIVQIDPDEDYKHTIVKVKLIAKNLKLPQNTTVQVKSFPNGELYLQFIYPQNSSLKLLCRGDMIEGITPYSLEEFMLGQNVSGVTDMVSIHVIKALDAMGVANMEMENFFRNTSKVIEGNRESIDASIHNVEDMTKSLAKTAENLNNASAKINKSLDTDVLKNSTLNIRDSTSNIKETTENINKATKDIDQTIKKLDSTMSEVNSAAANINQITGGLKQTLSKKFGGMRVILGTPIKSECP